ncbi:MAG: helicase HerA domain-containing protein [Cetobacterium sp.]
MSLELLESKNDYKILLEPVKYDLDANEFFIKNEIDYKDVSLYHITELTYEEKSPRREAFENIISSFREDGITLLYLLVGDERGVSFYLGVVRDKFSKTPSIDISDFGKNILKPTIEGNFRGSKVELLDRLKKEEIINSLNDYNNFGMIDGIPGVNESEDKSSFQGIDRLVDVMLGDKFCLGILIKPIGGNEFQMIEERLYEIYSNIAPLMKQTYQHGNNVGKNLGENISENITKSKNENKGTNSSESFNESKSKSKNNSVSVSDSTGSSSGSNGSSQTSSKNESKSTNKTGGTSSSITSGNTISKGSNESLGTGISQGFTTTKNEGTSSGETNTMGVEVINKNAQEWIKYIDEILFPMIDYGRSKGLYLMSTFICTDNRMNLIKLGSNIQSLFSGRKGNKMALQLDELKKDSNTLNYLKNLQIPRKDFRVTRDEERALTVKSKLSIGSIYQFANICSPNEISILTGLPQKEVVGLSLKEEVEFGLNFPKVRKKDSLELGYLIQTGRELKNIKVDLEKDSLNKHIFIAGVTGTGKTTTCQKILKKSGLPFLVIEPAKTEYRVLLEDDKDVIIFTLGKDTVAPFRINPFEFFEHESITARVDIIKASIEASFDMEAAIPQLIEAILYRCYEEYGWNISTNKNYRYENPFKDGVYSFPTLSDVIQKVQSVVDEQGFDDRLKNDYIGSIKARLQSLTVGSKGLMLDTPRSVDFKILLQSKVILELEEVKNAGEKSLIMGFVLGNLSEALKAQYKKNRDFKHITLIEEAHRLLSKYSPGDSQNKKQGVELFSDMLAEVRKYGESLIIVDQIPNKLTPEVLKNTNTKIVHKIFAEDDKEAIGNTMALSAEQKRYLSSLKTGEVILFSQGWDKAVQVQIEKETDTTGVEEVEEGVIHKNILKFYAKYYYAGIIIGSQLFENEPTVETMKELIEINQSFYCEDEFLKFINSESLNEKEKRILESYLKSFKGDVELLINFIYSKYYINRSDNKNNEKLEEIKNTLKILFDTNIKEKNLKNTKEIFGRSDFRILFVERL